MPEDTTATPQAGDAASPQEGNGTPQAGEPNTTTADSLSLEDAKKLKNEAQNLRRRIREFEEAEEARKTAQEAAQRQKAIEEGKLEQLLRDADEKAARLESDLKNERLNLLRIKVASDVGIPSEDAEQLRGETEAEMRIDAEKKKERWGIREAPVYAKGPAPGTQTDASKANEAAARTGQNQFVRSSF